MVLTTGNQLRAARALAWVDQQQIADSAKVNVNTIRHMEARGAKPITSRAVTSRRVQLGLEALVIEVLNHTRPDDRLSIPSERIPERRVERKPRRKRSATKRTYVTLD